MPYRKVLIIRLSALGDVAMTIPVVYSVCRAYPETTFVMLTQKVASQLFINAPRNLQVVVADVKGRHKGFVGLYHLAREVRRLSIGYAFQPDLRSRLSQGRSALPWRPWIFGHKDSHLVLATHSGILSSQHSTAPYGTASSR